MKATGIVRRIDDLGRIVIPKEIRKTLKIKEGDPLEIFVQTNEVMLKRYSPINSITDSVILVAKSLFKETNYSVVILDNECVVAAEGDAKAFLNDTLSKEGAKVFQEGKSFSISEVDNLKPIKLFNSDDGRFKSQLILPVTDKDGETLAVICLLDTDGKTKFGATEIRLLKLAGEFIKSKVLS
ncbi:MAG: AbrB/MazE/SpoVT family DNA-binding domain-containing protein [Clostridia bacterium]|nr:AbrB/MazE/SpoVT family DNA-binding domain-containing protein [Clostridia bacterium]